MKIAICFYGLLRDVKETYPYIKKNLIDPNNIEDIFIHTWKSEDNEEIGSKSKKTVHHSSIYDKLYKEFILSNYNPKVFNEEDNDIILTEKNYKENYMGLFITSPFAFQSMLYSSHKVNLLKNEYANKNAKTYDYVVKMRFDLVILKPIIISNLSNDILNVTSFYTKNNWMGDIFAISNEQTMNTYTNLWNCFYEYKLKQNHPEQLNYHHCTHQGIEFLPSLIYGVEGDHILYRDIDLITNEL